MNGPQLVAIALWCAAVYNLPRIAELETRRAGVGVWRVGTCFLAGWLLWHLMGAS